MNYVASLLIRRNYTCMKVIVFVYVTDCSSPLVVLYTNNFYKLQRKTSPSLALPFFRHTIVPILTRTDNSGAYALWGS